MPHKYCDTRTRLIVHIVEEKKENGLWDEAKRFWYQVHTLLEILVCAVIRAILNFIREQKVAGSIENDPYQVEQERFNEKLIPEKWPC